MNSEELARIEAGCEAEVEEIDAVSEALQKHGIVSEERHNQILEGVNVCRSHLESLSNRIETLEKAESPVSSRILEEMMALKGELESLKDQLRKLSTDSRLSNPPPNESIIVVAPAPPILANEEPNQEDPIAEPVQDEPPKPEAKKRRFRVL